MKRKNIALITELDNTLLYPEIRDNSSNESLCIEYKNRKPVSYMPKGSLEIFSRLLDEDNFLFIPCTTRSIEQAERIQFIRERKPRYMICDNGASIYINGRPDKQYDRFISSIIRRSDIRRVYEHLLMSEECYPDICWIICSRESLITVEYTCRESLDSDFYDIIDDVNAYSLGTNRYRFIKSGRKIYIIPRYLDKAVAVEYLLKRYGINAQIITVGDSILDRNFMKLGDDIIWTEHGSYYGFSSPVYGEGEFSEKIMEHIRDTYYSDRLRIE